MIRFGIDLFSLRSQGWNPFECLEYCASQGVQLVHFSEPRFLGSLEDCHLRQVRSAADHLGLAIEIGMLSICPTSGLFDPRQGSPAEQLRRMIHAACVIGSPLVRAVLGNRNDRRSPIPMQAHIENTVRVLQSVREDALAAGIRIAMENHGGDLAARELKFLVEEAGTDFVGVCVDSGNLPLTFDLPLDGLELLAPYALTSHIRDTRVWRTDAGFAVQWVPAGEGNVGLDEFLRRYIALLPGRPVTLETIVVEPRALNFREAGFWNAFPNLPASQFARYLEMAEQGTPYSVVAQDWRVTPDRERQNAETSLRHCRRIVQHGP